MPKKLRLKKIKKSKRSKILERAFQKDLIKEIKKRFKGCMVLKLDANYIQGIPDLLILFGKAWATLECKRDPHAAHRPNQDYYVYLMNNMSFSKFINPQNKERILNDLEKFFTEK